MKLGRLAQLVLVNLRRDKRGMFLSALGVAAGIGALAFFVALGSGVGEVVRTRVFPTDARLVEVIPPKVSVGLFGGVHLDDEAVERLRALPRVEAVHRKMQLRIPAVSRYDGVFFGQRLRMGLEILGEGVDPGLVAPDLDQPERFVDPGEQGPVPVVISSRLLEIYNKSFAKNRGLPALQAGMLGGFQFPVAYGRSYVTASAAAGSQVVRRDAMLVGVSDRAMLQGITLPLEAARRLNAHFGEDAERYSAVVLTAKSPDAVPALAQAVREMGFEIDDGERAIAERVGAAVAITTAALALLSLLICALAAVNIALTLGASIRNRSREIGILRAVGATSRDVALLVVGEAAVVGLLGGTIGAALALAAGRVVDAAARSFLPEFPFKPESFFLFPPWLLAGAVALGIVAALLGAYPPARGAARLDPARAIGA
ncbi:ABC transporter permease [Vulgatibacter sp.]|uniref:ABC transporter permease n=1 Tax=Vulgatibacter sp. TaxID=1971226 RepID=UPI0035673CBD